MITDLFSHKIHSSSPDWPDKLVELAGIFGEFDGLPYDRDAIEQRLSEISPRAAYVAQSVVRNGDRADVSKFRDEISAYPAYLGIYHHQRSPQGWLIKVSETTKRFLLCEEPDVGSFLRLQMPLFQYPNAMGVAYYKGTNNIRLQANSADRLLGFINAGVHFSPVRLIAQALLVDSEISQVPQENASVSFDEIFILANTSDINRHAQPPYNIVKKKLLETRRKKISLPIKYESRFHTLTHTELFQSEKGRITLRAAVNEADKRLIVRQLNAIAAISMEFREFDNCKTREQLKDAIETGAWYKYFDGVSVLPAAIVKDLTSDGVLQLAGGTHMSEQKLRREGNAISVPNRESAIATPVATNSKPKPMETYPFRERTGSLPEALPYNRNRELADPELTRIKRQKRNLAHKELVSKMDDYLRNQVRATTRENDHIDLFASIPTDGSFIFEMKSGGESLLDQIRKGLSQLYEYRYRYKQIIDTNISLCLVLPSEPKEIPWITDYLCIDREIAVCWFNNDELSWPSSCEETMQVLRAPKSVGSLASSFLG
ncbi:hypothetical protein hmeg3_24285 [Herbaspirillum sp. meg3]|uniref:hypothetical protein n=1 Tax=Herbaspirillum sp. meg3 TaxID=2025949 RepID=UPI000B99C395|nr:hypothetical protein [Herbaspirillum sp. meg3]ASU41111.1 hypothetical protein hmeg3_24285 [Herbaspirillum sp. meg3]